MEYQNQLCGGCGLPMSEGEDIVFCPECGAPQHRACYEKEGHCVFADRHAEGFSWTADKSAAAPVEGPPCPLCGNKNPPGATGCSRCGQSFAPEEMRKIARFIPGRNLSPSLLVDELFFDAPRGVTEIQLDDDEREQVEFVISQRMLQSSPGMTEEQAQERLCGHPLRQVMTFLSSHALTFVNKFRKLEAGSAFTWNWAAFFLTPYWFFYRKLYKPGIVVLTLRICLTLAIYNPVTRVSEVMMAIGDAARDGSLTEAMYAAALEQISAYAPVMMISFGVLLLLAVLSGLLADRLYHRHIQQTLDRLKEEESRDAFLVQFLRKSSVSPIFAALSYAAISIIPNLVMSFIIQ